MKLTLSTPAGRPLLVQPKAPLSAVASAISKPRHGKAVRGPKPNTVLYTPGPGHAGSDSFSFKLAGVTYHCAITVARNRRPQAYADKVATSFGSPVVIDVMKNDVDHDGHAFKLKSVGKPAHGTALIGAGKIRYLPKQGFYGTDRFTYRLIDSEGAEEVGNVTVTVARPVIQSPPPPPPPPAPAPVIAAGTKPYNGKLIGCAVHLDAVGNHRYEYGKPAAFRFCAEHTGTVKTVRWVNRRDTGTGSAHVGYSKGHGGTLRIELRANDPKTNMPAKAVLAWTANHAAASLPFYAEVPFLAPFAKTVEGQIYHLVFIQLDSSGKNSISVNMLHTKSPIPFGGNGRFGPFHGDILCMMCSDNNEKSWRVRDDRGPIFELQYDNGIAYGQGWIYGHDSGQRPIGTANMARQRYVLDSDEVCKGIWFRPRKQNTPTTLLIALKQAGQVLGAITVDPQHIVTSTLFDRPVPWMYLAFPERLQLSAGKLYDLEFSAAQGSYFLAAVQRGTNWGYQDRNIPRHPSAFAEHSEDRGQSWKGWSFTSAVQGTKPHKDMDLSCALVLV